MKESCGKKHNYLGMYIYFSVNGDVRVKITGYLNNIVYEFPKTIQGRVTTPAAEHIFIVMEDANRKLLDKYCVTALHHSAARILFYTPRVMKDIYTDVVFITTRVKSPGEDD